jgi:hypothetical protein
MNTHKCEWCGFTEDVLNPSDEPQDRVHALVTKEPDGYGYTYKGIHLCFGCLLNCLLHKQEKESREVVRKLLLQRMLDKILRI